MALVLSIGQKPAEVKGQSTVGPVPQALPQPDFMDQDDAGHDQQGQKIVDYPEAEQGRDDRLGMGGLGRAEDDQLEEPCAARNMADHDGDHGQKIQTQKLDEVHAQVGWHEHEQTVRGHHQIGPGHQNLG